MATKLVTLAELRTNNNKDSLWVLIHGKVYDVTKFIDEHPGGDEVVMAEANGDATEAFEDVGHSDEARELLPGMLVGDFDTSSGDLKLFDSGAKSTGGVSVTRTVEQGSNLMYVLPLAGLGAYFAWRYYTGAE